MIIIELKNLLERNPDVKSYVSIFDLIEKYKNTPNVFIHFSTPFESGDTKVKMFKAGFNPKQNWGNPYGFYCYIINEIDNYASNLPQAYIVKRVPDGLKQIDKIDEMSKLEYEKCIKIIKQKFTNNYPKKITDILFSSKFDKILNTTIKSVENKSYGGILFYFIINISNSEIGKKLFPNNRPNVIQYKIWKNWLGYSFIGDLNGTGIIHPNEKFQVLFLTLASFKVIDQNNVEISKTGEFNQKNYSNLKTVKSQTPKLINALITNNKYIVKKFLDSGIMPTSSDIYWAKYKSTDEIYQLIKNYKSNNGNESL